MPDGTVVRWPHVARFRLASTLTRLRPQSSMTIRSTTNAWSANVR